jgi:hypothetical protein
LDKEQNSGKERTAKIERTNKQTMIRKSIGITKTKLLNYM